MWYNVQPYTVIRNVTTDPSVPRQKEQWEEVGTIYGTFMPMTWTEKMRNHQEFSDVKYMLICGWQYNGDVQDFDEVIAPDDARYRVRAVTPHGNVLRHIEVYLGDVQTFREYIPLES